MAVAVSIVVVVVAVAVAVAAVVVVVVVVVAGPFWMCILDHFGFNLFLALASTYIVRIGWARRLGSADSYFCYVPHICLKLSWPALISFSNCRAMSCT